MAAAKFEQSLFKAFEVSLPSIPSATLTCLRRSYGFELPLVWCYELVARMEAMRCFAMRWLLVYPALGLGRALRGYHQERVCRALTAVYPYLARLSGAEADYCRRRPRIARYGNTTI